MKLNLLLSRNSITHGKKNLVTHARKPYPKTNVIDNVN